MKSLIAFIKDLEANQELVRIKEHVSTNLEITEISERMMKQPGGGKALLFENNETKFPVLINHYGSDKRMCMSLGIKNYDEPGEKMDSLFGKLTKPQMNFRSKLSLLPELLSASGWMPKKRKGRGECQQVVIDNPDFDILPILKCWPLDGGRFITLPMVISEDPENGIRNIGMYRMQIYDKKNAGMHWHLHKGGAKHYEKYKKMGKRMPVSVVIGGDPALTYASTAPLPENIDEFMLAGFLKNKGVKLVKSITNDIYVPENADFVIEGYIDTQKELKTEGPFGDHTGFYSLQDKYPVFTATCITHKKDAVYPATIVGVPPMEDYYIGKATERIFLKPIQISFAPEVLDIRLPGYGVAHNLVLVKAKIDYAGQSIKIMNSLLGAGQMMFTKVIACFDETVDIHDDEQVINAFNKNVCISDDVILSKGPSDVLDHAAYKYTFGGKLIIDATSKTDNDSGKEENKITKIDSENYSFLLLHDKTAIISVDKSIHGNIKDFFNKNVNSEDIKNLKLIVAVDDFVKLDEPYLLAWYILNNIDASKDCKIINEKLFIDATVKNKEDDNFHRYWPNVVSMDAETISKIDELWKKLFPDSFVESPSKKVQHLINGTSDVFGK